MGREATGRGARGRRGGLTERRGARKGVDGEGGNGKG